MKYRLGNLHNRAKRQWTNIKGGVLGNLINVYWWDDRTNFGDLITPALLKTYGLTPQYTRPEDATLVSTGSILQRLPSDFSGFILGSGLIDAKPVHLPNAKFLAIRGALSRSYANAPDDLPLGDPGLLAYRLIGRRPQKKHELGVIPHYVDKDNDALMMWVSGAPNTVFIDVERSPEKVTRDIARCKYIASSSLHGVITAHSLGIPAVWLRVSDKVKGGKFKFQDYASSLDMQLYPLALDPDLDVETVISATTLPKASLLHSRQNVLNALFQSLSVTLEKSNQAREVS